jgi:hypothetical protein
MGDERRLCDVRSRPFSAALESGSENTYSEIKDHWDINQLRHIPRTS